MHMCVMKSVTMCFRCLNKQLVADGQFDCCMARLAVVVSVCVSETRQRAFCKSTSEI